MEFINDPANKGKWRWQANFRFQLRDGSTTPDVYESVDDRPDMLTSFRTQDGTDLYQALKQMEQQHNQTYGVTWGGAPSQQSNGAKSGGSSKFDKYKRP